MKNQNLEIGRALFEQLHGARTGAVIGKQLGEISPDYWQMILEWSYAGISSRPGLDMHTRLLLILASCVTLGHPAQIRAYLETAVGAGIKREAILETLLQMLPLVGFPAVTNAMLIAHEVLGAEGVK